MHYADVVIDQKSRYTDSLFTYASEEPLRPGQRVQVPFGKGDRTKTAYVFYPDVTPDESVLPKLKTITNADPDVFLTEEMIRTCEWMRLRYGIKYIEAVNCFVPKGRPPKPGKEKRPYAKLEVPDYPDVPLTEEQRQAAEKICASIGARENAIYLIHGVTSSGKTEVYLQAVKKALEEGRSAIVLEPEIALTKQLYERLAGRFGKDEVAVLHSRLTGRERYDEWMRLRRGEARIAIGARAAVFAPLENIGVIILDEEHEATYKADQTPKFETVDVAAKRMIASGGTVVLGSATPSAVSYERALEGTYRLVEMKQRYNRTPLPNIELVDQRQELRVGNRSVFSRKLYQHMKKTLSDGEQIILFQNRRGYSTYIACGTCGESLKCPDCGITLVWHKRENAAVCHYCGRRFPVPAVCPSCGADDIRYFGVGTEQVEESARELFPEAVVDRLDLDTVKSTREIDRILNAFAKRKTDILIGTQLVAKGLDFENVGLVGVISADVSLNIPDYRSTERTFQLVTQVAGRAGRGDRQGLVLVQTCTPENFALKAAVRHDYRAFFDEEIRVRRFMDYPPFTDLIAVEFTSEEEPPADRAAEDCRGALRAAGLPNSQKIFAPKPTQSFRGQNAYRCHILIKCPRGARRDYMLRLHDFAEKLKRENPDVSMLLDVNPYSTF